MIVAGVDLGGKKAAVALLDGSTITVHTFASKAETRQDQLFEVADFVWRTTEDADVVYVEEPLIGRGVRASLQVAQAAGAVLSSLSIPAYLVPVTTWKKRVVGSGNATKEAVAFWLNNHYPVYADNCEEDQDLADATCIALYGRDTQDVAHSLSDLFAEES